MSHQYDIKTSEYDEEISEARREGVSYDLESFFNWYRSDLPWTVFRDWEAAWSFRGYAFFILQTAKSEEQYFADGRFVPLIDEARRLIGMVEEILVFGFCCEIRWCKRQQVGRQWSEENKRWMARNEFHFYREAGRLLFARPRK